MSNVALHPTPPAEVVERNKKLLRLGQSPNVHEAELAMERAHALAAKHLIDLSSVPVDDRPKSRLERQDVPHGRRLSAFRKEALRLAIGHFNVDVVYTRTGGALSVVFIGLLSDIAIAQHVVAFLAATCERLWLAKAAEHGWSGIVFRDGFIKGFFLGLDAKLSAQKKALEREHSGLAMVLRDAARARLDFVGAEFGEIGTKKDRNRPMDISAARAGYRAGWETELNPALSQGEAPAQIGRAA